MPAANAATQSITAAPLLIGLHGKAKPVPAGQSDRRASTAATMSSDSLQPVGLLGIDRKADVGSFAARASPLSVPINAGTQRPDCNGS